MDTKEHDKKSLETKTMLDNANYYKYIFKKSEKIVCAVFYILRNGHNKDTSDTLVSDIEETAKRVLNTALGTLSREEYTIQEDIRTLRDALIALESMLRVAHVAHLISSEHLTVFLNEFDVVYRGIRSYTEHRMRHPLDEVEERDTLPVRRGESVRHAPRSTRAVGTPRIDGSGVSDMSMRSRQDRIKDFLRDNPNATIKDITMVIKDCSEKTIQRELIEMIKDNVVVREGERRWSKYRLA